MKKMMFKDPKNKLLWMKFKKEVSNLAKKRGIFLLNQALGHPVLVTLAWPSSRGFDGILESFVVDKTLWSKCKKILQRHEIYFGEIAGKHSEVYGSLTKENITENSNMKFIKNWISENGIYSTDKHSFIFTLLSSLEENEHSDFVVLNKLAETLKK